MITTSDYGNGPIAQYVSPKVLIVDDEELICWSIKERLLEAMRDFQRRIKDPFANADNIAAFLAEQKEYQEKSYRVSDFRWPHLDLFEQAQKAN